MKIEKKKHINFIKKKKSINYIKKLLKSKLGKHKTLMVFTVGWTRFFRRSKLTLGLTKSLILKDSLLLRYFGISINLSKWNFVFFNAGINSRSKLYHKGIDLDNTIFNKRFIKVKGYWDSGIFYVNRKSGSKTFAPWESKLKPTGDIGIRDLTYLNSYTFSIPKYSSVVKSKYKLPYIIEDSKYLLDIKNSSLLIKTTNHL